MSRMETFGSTEAYCNKRDNVALLACHAEYWPTHEQSLTTIGPVELERDAAILGYGPYAGTHGMSAMVMYIRRCHARTFTVEDYRMFKLLAARH